MQDNIKLKIYLYHDKTLLYEKIKLSEFEENIDKFMSKFLVAVYRDE